MKNYISILREDLTGILEWIRFATNERKNDVNDFNNLNQFFISGRKVGRIPTGSANVLSTDRVGDINYTQDYLYILILDNTNAAKWRRVALGTW